MRRRGRISVKNVAIRCAVTVGCLVVGPGVIGGAVALGDWWFLQPSPETATVSCDDDYEYTADDETFENKHGDVCVRDIDTGYETVAADWPIWASVPVGLGVFIVFAIGFIGGAMLLLGGPFAAWADDEYLPDVRKPERVVWRNL